MEWITTHWYAIAIALILLGDAVVVFRKFSTLTKEQKYESIQGWLLQAVLWAEGEFGSGTGKLKLSSVYAEFCKQVPWLAKVVPFAKFSSWVDDALVEMKRLLEKNDAIADYVITKEVTK